MKFKSVFPTSARDFVLLSTRERISDSRLVIASTSCDEIPESSDFVRGVVFASGYIIDRINDHSSKLTYLAHSDIRGSIPGFIKNKVSLGQGEKPNTILKAMKSAGYK